MRTIDSDILAKLEGRKFRPFLLMDLDIDSTHYRYTDCDIALVLDGDKYSPRGFEVENINYSMVNVVDSVQISLDNLDTILTAVFVGGTPLRSDILLYLVLVDDDMTLVGGTSVTLFEGVLDSWSLDEEAVNIVVTSPFTRWNQRTIRRHSASCRWKKFKGTECGYVGDATWCDRSFARCNALGNEAKFGGFRWLPSIEHKEIWWGRTQG